MKRFITVLMVLLVGAVCLFGADYYIENYDVQVTVGNDAVHHVVETIDVYFIGGHHGIVREIPIDYSDYNGMSVHVENLKCSEVFEKGEDNGYLIMKIGSSSRTITGPMRYVISYDYDIGADMNEGYDEFYFNIIPHNWECRIDNVSYSVEIPYVEGHLFDSYEAFSDYIYENSWATGGSYGSTGTDNLEFYFYEYKDKSGVLFEGTDSGLGPYEGETIRVEFPDQWYQGARQRWDKRPVMAVVSPVVTILLCAIAMFIWARYGKDKTPIVVARWTAPEDFSPLMVGYVADSSVDDKDVISMLFYWADEGLLSIEEVGKEKYEFTKLMDIMDYAVQSGKNIPSHEISLFNGFFKNCSVGDKMTFDKLEKNNFYETIVETKLKTKGYFKKDRSLNDRKSMSFSVLLCFASLIPLIVGIMRIGMYENSPDTMLFACIATLLLFVMNLGFFSVLFQKWYLRKSNALACILCAIPSILATLMFMLTEAFTDVAAPNVLQCVISVVGSSVVAFFGVITERRSEYGDKVFEEILGFRDFIEKVEIDKLKMMIDEDPDLYFRILSYALVLGLEDKWAKKFDGMIVPQPSWYTGRDAFNAYYMSRMARNMYRTIPAASIPKSQIKGTPGSRVGGGGFHSSGFSGGGFGGGGGHAW